MRPFTSVRSTRKAVVRLSNRATSRFDRSVGSLLRRVRATRFSRWLANTPPARIMRSNLSLRMAVSMTLLGVILFSFLFAFVSAYIRTSLFENRRDIVLADAANWAASAQSRFDQATVVSPEQVQDVAYQLLSSIKESAAGAGAVGVVLLRSPESDANNGINEIVEPNLRPLVSTQMREAVAKKPKQFWQSVAIPIGNGKTEPGIIVGSTTQLPLAGTYELYIVYSLEPEEQTAQMVVGVLTASSAVLIILLGALTWGISYTVLLPVRQTALAAEHIADGELDARVEVDGEDELAVLGASFNDMADSLQRQLVEYRQLATLQQRFVSDVSHELRTPLTTVRMAADIIHDAREDFDPVTRRSTELMYTQIERLEQMLSDLLEISRFDAQAADLSVDTIDLRDTVTKVIEVSKELADRLGVELRTKYPKEACTAEVDSRRIERILRNLLFNAVEHAENKPVEVEIGVNENAVGIRVRDHGVGMSQDVVRHVFDRFYRADPARTRTTGGTGLGLAIATEDANLHGGTLEAAGVLGEGSSFLLTVVRHLDQELTDPPLALRDEDLEAAYRREYGPELQSGGEK